MTARRPRLVIWRSAHTGQWYWRFVAGNGKCLADGAEGYRRQRGAEHGASIVLSGAPHDTVVLP